MNSDELTALITEGRTVRISLDTNISRSSMILMKLLELAELIAAQDADIGLVVSAPAFAEILMDLRAKYGDRYDADMIDQFIIGNTKLHIADFTDADAAHMAERLATRFSDDGSWQSAKIEAAFGELRLSSRIEELRRPAARCSATIDWLIGSQADRAGWVLATDDKGPEFRDMARVVDYTTLRASLEGLARTGAA